MKKQTVIISLLFSILLSACNNSSTQNEANESSLQTEEVAEESTPTFQAVPSEFGDRMMKTCTGVEITFYQVGASISSQSCAAFFGLIDNSVPNEIIKEEFGHMLFLASGELITLAKIHLKEDKGYLKFQDGEKFYYQNFNEQGIKFFNNVKTQQAPQ
jgi:hypothetical protein